MFYPPRHINLRFDTRGRDVVRELNVYPVAGLLTQYPERDGHVRENIEQLRVLLKNRTPGSQVRGALPLLPQIMSGQVFHAAVKYVDFPGGRGVRYLTTYSFDVAPILRGGVFYTFQGLTNDGKHYVSLRYDVALPELPASENVPEVKRLMDALYSGGKVDESALYDAHLARTQRQLDALTNDTRLTRLDAFVRSIRVR
jgi:hypothetical protein